MEGFPAVSAMCLTYGRPQVLEEAVESFLRQDYPGPRELVVLNDFAEQTLVCEHPDVRIINVPARFRTVGEKRNACAALASHDLLFVWDDDDIYLPWRLSLSVRKLDIDQRFYKPGRAWTFNDGRLDGPKVNLFHSSSCFLRSLFDEAHGYPHIGSGQDLGLEMAMEKLIRGPKDDQALPLEEHYYIYRWSGTGSYHLSAFGRDKAGAVPGNAKVAEYVDRQVSAGKITTGTIVLEPRWREDYLGLVQREIASRRTQQSTPTEVTPCPGS